MKLEILTPDQTLFSGTVTSVTLPGKDGYFTVWENHAPIISSLVGGVITYEHDNIIDEIEIENGFAEISHNLLTVCLELY
jgi:F-type H+-transporting ATPase subunit epsilon